MEWELNPVNPRTCEACAAQHAQFRKETPCGTCKLVWLIPENELAAQIFFVLLSQLRVGGMGGVFGVDYASLPFMFKVFEVPEELYSDTFERLQVMVNSAIKIFNEKSKR